jgi:CubicO group peptidase (beta-lactamase class C family)
MNRQITDRIHVPVCLGRLACVVAVLLSAPVLTAAQESFLDAHADDIEAVFQGGLADGPGGMVIGLFDAHGSRVFAAGKLDNGTDKMIDGDTIFEIGSVTKVFTVLLLLDSVRRGEVQLEDPVAEYLPRSVTVPARGNHEITLLHLAAQDSGLPFNPDNFSKEDWIESYNAYTVDDLYAFLGTYKLEVDPGAGFQYSNVGMALLGHVIERRSGTDYESLVVSRICRPLKMDSTLITVPPNLSLRVATGYDREGKRAPRYDLQALAPGGALLSTANDLLKFLCANLGFTQTDLNPLMKEMQVIRHTKSPQWGKSAMPWVDEAVYNPPGSELLGHAGGCPGCASFIGLDLKKQRGVVVLSNQKTLRPAAIGWRILQEMPLTTDNTLVREYVGIGIGLDTDKNSGMPRIAVVYPQSPAGKVGLPVGLLVRSIDGISVEGKTPRECASMIGGPLGGKVRLELLDPQDAKARTVDLTRQRFITAK